MQCAWQSESVEFNDDQTFALPPKALDNEAMNFLAMAIEPGEMRTIQILGAARSGDINCLLHGYGTVSGLAASAVSGETILADAGVDATSKVPPQMRLLNILSDLPPIFSNDIVLTG